MIGVRLTDTPSTGAASLERLLEHHLYSRKGLAVLPAGDSHQRHGERRFGPLLAATTRTTSFGPLFKQTAAYTRVSDPLAAATASISPTRSACPTRSPPAFPARGLPTASEANAMQVALWPATIGYFMDALMDPVFSDATVRTTREFFTRFVSGRGPLPALRIGMQPYGIQPTVAFGRLAWFGGQQDEEGTFLANAVNLIRSVEDDYRALLPKVSRIGADHEDSHQALLDVVGLHPTSVEYYPLGADSLEHKSYELSFFSSVLVTRLLALFPNEEPLQLLRRLGYGGQKVPDILTKIYHRRLKPLDGPLVDDVPLSETAPIRAICGQSQLHPVAHRRGTGQRRRSPSGTRLRRRQAPRCAALPAAPSRRAVGLPYDGDRPADRRPARSSPRRSARAEPAFVHVADGAKLTSESRYAVLFQPNSLVTEQARAYSRRLHRPKSAHLASKLAA